MDITLAEQLVQTARAKKVELATAESLTAGLVGATICDVPGASAVYRGGVISYSSDIKASVLGVSAKYLKEHGAVDPEVAAQMAAGVARVCGADYAVATTGLAGPDPADGKDVGTVFIGLYARGEVSAYGKKYVGSRADIRQATVADALEILLLAVKQAEDFTLVNS